MRYRIGLLVDDTRVSKWVRDLVDWIDRHPDIEVAALIVHPATQSSVKGFGKFAALARSKGPYLAVSRAAFALLSAVERKLVLRGEGYSDHHQLHEIGDRIPTHVHTKPIVSKSGFVYRFGEEDLSKIRALDLDALVRCGNGILKGGILSAARHGVISMHHADNRVNRGGPAGFWEVLQGQPQTGFIIQQLNEELDGGDVLFRGSVRTDLFYSRNKASLSDRATAYLGRTLEQLMRGELTREPPHVYHEQLYKTPLLHDTLAYALRTSARLARRAVRRAIGRHWHWGVGYVFQPWQKAVLWRGKVLAAPQGTFVADPFAIKVGESHFIFVEEYSYRTGKGVISAFRVTPGEAERIGVVLEEPFHLSFPFVFRHGEDIYMLPETSGDSSITLYRAEQFPTRWTVAKVIARDVSAVDNVMFEHGDRWWMLTTMKGEGEAPNDAELHAFWAQDPLGDWTAHARNPVVMDSSRGRNGGLLRDDAGNVYRVGQRHAFTRYGAGFSIYRIDELSPDSYAETLVQDVDPRFLKGISGTHHMHEDSGLTVYDFCRDERPRQ